MASLVYWRTMALALSLPFLISGTGAQEVSTLSETQDKEDKLWFHFVTRPDIQAPNYDVRIYNENALSPGYWFVSPYEDADKMARGQPWVGPYIYDGHGDLVWAGTPLMDHHKLWDFKVSKVNGKDMLSGISQRDNAGFILNDHYELVKSVPWAPNWSRSNMHEFNVVEDGSRVLVATKEEHKKLSLEISRTVGFEGRCEVTADGIKELDVTGDSPRTIFDWQGIDHLPLSESIMRPNEIDRLCTHNLDLYHINSIDKFPDGDYLISSRHTCTIYRVSHIDGSIVWRLGGLQSDFQLPAEAQFSRQHNARFIKQNATHTLISLFDNSIGWLEKPTQDHSRGLILALHNQQNKVEVLQTANHPLGNHSESRGSNQLLPNGNFFLCWADRARLSEHSPDGKLLMHSYLKPNIDSYRAYKFPWIGRPKQPPDVYSTAFTTGLRTDVKTTITYVYVSWNGATEVASWRLYESDAKGKRLGLLKERLRQGFETEIKYLGGYARYVVVEAVDRKGQPLGRSRVVETVGHPEQDLGEPNESLLEILTDPFSAFIAGFVACAVICLMICVVQSFAGRQWWKPKSGRYTPVEGDEPDDMFGHGGEVESDDAVELKARPQT